MKFDTKEFSRRTFIKGSLAAGAALGLGTALDLSGSPFQAAKAKGESKIVHSACPRNCYDTCSILSTVEDGVLKRVEGDKANTYTRGRLCAKGFSYTRSVYSPDRIKYPMRQSKRGGGRWERISWPDAFDIIAKKILAIKKEYGNTLPICLDKYSGNFNLLNYCVEGMMSSIGHTTRATGTPCWPAGIDAQTFDFGTIWNNDPEDMVNSKYMIIWGANPSWCSVHSMHLVMEAKKRGCKIVVIDPILTQTASKADWFIQIKPSTDGALALGIAKYLLDNNMVDYGWLAANAKGYEEFFQYVREKITLDWVAEKTGVKKEIIEQLAREYGTAKPASIWIGYGMQRHTNGGQNVRSIDALAAMTGNIGKSGGGAQYAQLQTWGVKYNVMGMKAPAGTTTTKDRIININNSAQEILDANDPPIKMLWIACRSPLTQAAEPQKLKEAYDKLDLVVTADLFMNPTVQMSDIVLPVTTPFETWGLNVSYWHYWCALNEPAIEPQYEAKSDLEIAMGLSKKLNELEPGSCTFPTEGKLEDWVAAEFTPDFLKQFGLTSWDELKKGPRKAVTGLIGWQDGKFKTPSGKYEFASETAVSEGHELLPVWTEEMKTPEKYPLRLMSPHWKLNINGQFQNLDWMMDIHSEPVVEMHPETAARYHVQNGDMVKLYNEQGAITLKAKLTKVTAPDTLVVYEMWLNDKDFNVNNTLKSLPADMGKKATGAPGIAFHDNFVALAKA
ncbi:MAG: twin-arginine translocation signal domain-containing protein [Selenomonas ruminantium]|jgi:anaerobic selenocysteine-containing dehydrogenase|uniref:Twin-arginine translocation signal domain-containing protein n=1 Tax=Selenomonas ruminantium TaxID=971 RepID=A0A927ZSH1_SELRU|nr:molybdopterin-dependent oxidoreductase [Selenomonas ruminantium]MBE6085346.1 twin-arginine translocation signal domain-containing protein [Selenomonas ruminantium]